MAIKTFLENDEITRMIAGATNTRDEVLMRFFADTGCRVSEVIGLKVEDLDLETETVAIQHLKHGIKKTCPSCRRAAGRHQPFCSRCGADLSEVEAEGIQDRGRLISIGPELNRRLKEYTRDMKPSERLFPLTRQRVHSIVREAAAGIGLVGRVMYNPETRRKHYVHPHNFRDSLAVPWLGEAKGDSSMQKALQEHFGHQNFETTMRYAKLTPSNVRDAANRIREMRFGKS